MKLVGATDWFIRWPFVIEGVVLGALGGFVAVLLLLVGKVALLDPLVERLRAARRAEDDPLRPARRCAARRRDRCVARSARGCRCGASCASERGCALVPCGRPCAVAARLPRVVLRCRPRGGAARARACGSAGATRTGCRALRARARRRQRHTRRPRGDRPRSTTPTTARSPGPCSPTTRSRAWSPSSTTASPTTSPGRVQALQAGAALGVHRRRAAGRPASEGPARRSRLRRLAGQARRHRARAT